MQTYSRAQITTGLVVGVVAVSSAAILIRFAIGDDAGVSEAAPGHAAPLAVAFWRTVGGSLALVPFAVRHQRRAEAPLSRRDQGLLAASGAFLAAHFALWLWSLALTTVASSVTLVTMSPIFVALGGWWFLGERTTRRTWIGMAVTIVGAITIGFADAAAIDLGPRALAGDALAFGGALAVTGYLLIGRLLRRRLHVTTYASVVYGWAAAILLVLCLSTGTDLWGYDGTVWLAIAGLIVGPQLLGHTVFNTLLSSVSATVVSIVVLAEPVGATLLAWLLLDELPAPLFWLGAPLVLVGVAVATARRRTATARRPSGDQRAADGTVDNVSAREDGPR
ncbi:MAG: DMT family transporter [Nitriliruptorales bacterium]|nr:DMT family transporter [Nitriliruptorales bacterium]